MSVDEAKLAAQVQGLTREQLEAQLLKIRTRQVTQQLKQKAKGGQSTYQKKQRELFKLLKGKAEELGIYDDLNTRATTAAKTALGITDQSS
jgi:hypothetical protein